MNCLATVVSFAIYFFVVNIVNTTADTTILILLVGNGRCDCVLLNIMLVAIRTSRSFVARTMFACVQVMYGVRCSFG